MSTAHSEFTATGGAGQDEEGYELTSVGGDWDDLAQEAIEHSDERIVVNMGPQHPSTHGVLRLILELDAETVTDARVGIGYLHTGIEKNMEYRSWTQGVTFCTRMDYLTPLFQEAAYCLAIEKLLGITDQVPERANVIRVLMMELNRIGSHLVCTGTGGMELGATTVMEFGFRERERILRFFEAVTGLRMNHAYIRPGGVIQDVPAEAIRDLRAELPDLRRGIHELELLINEQPILKGRMENVGYLDLTGCMALGVTGPMLRATGYPYDLRKAEPYCGYETYDFEVATWDTSDAYGRLRLRFTEMWESLKIVEQCLIHHFKLVTEGFRVPAGQAYQAVESPKGELGCHLVSMGGTRPHRAHFRDPGFNNLQTVAAMCEGAQVAEVIVAVASVDPVLGGVDR